MTLYDACVLLDMIPQIKVLADMCVNYDIFDKDKINEIAKEKFREMSLKCHTDLNPDREHSEFIEVKNAYDMILSIKKRDVNSLLEYIKMQSRPIYKPGSPECNNCSKWSTIVKSCSTADCTGYKQNKDLATVS